MLTGWPPASRSANGRSHTCCRQRGIGRASSDALDDRRRQSESIARSHYGDDTARPRHAYEASARRIWDAVVEYGREVDEPGSGYADARTKSSWSVDRVGHDGTDARDESRIGG